MDAKLEMKIPSQLIEDTIRAEMIRQMPNKDAFAAAVIKQALEQKVHSYDRTTIFQNALTDMVRDEAKTVFKEWLNQNREAIRSALLKELTKSKAARVKKIAEDLADGLKYLEPHVSLRLADAED